RSLVCFFFKRRRGHTSWVSDWSSDVCSPDLAGASTCSSVLFIITADAMTVNRWNPSMLRPQPMIVAQSTEATAITATSAARFRRSEERRVGKGGRARGGADRKRERRGRDESA